MGQQDEDEYEELKSRVKEHDIYVSDGKNWRITLIGLAITMAVQVGGGLYLAGQLTERLSNVYQLTLRIQERQDKDEAIIQGLIRDSVRNYTRKE